MTQLTLADTAWVQACTGLVLANFQGASFTSDDLHSFLPEPMHQNQWGALVGRLAKAGKIRRIGSRPSRRIGRNGSWIGVYEVVQQ